MDFTKGNFDLQTIKILSGSSSIKQTSYAGTSVFIGGRRVTLFNVYDALEMALRDELGSSVGDQEIVDIVCDLMMDDVARAKDDICAVYDLENWLTPDNLLEACTMEMVLPLNLVGRISLRLRNCLRRVQELTEFKECSYT